MNRKMVVLLVFLLILVGIIIIGKQKEQAIQLEKVETTAANQLRRITAEAQKAKRMALEETRRIEAAAQREKQAALEKARIAEAKAQKAEEMAQETVRQKAAEIQAKIDDLVAQANTLLGSAEYQKAINISQAILSLDPDSSEATSIVEKATAKLKEAAAKQVEAVTDAIQVPAAVSGE